MYATPVNIVLTRLGSCFAWFLNMGQLRVAYGTIQL